VSLQKQRFGRMAGGSSCHKKLYLFLLFSQFEKVEMERVCYVQLKVLCDSAASKHLSRLGHVYTPGLPLPGTSASLGIVSQELALVLERYLERDFNFVTQAILFLISNVIIEREVTRQSEPEVAVRWNSEKLNYRASSIWELGPSPSAKVTVLLSAELVRVKLHRPCSKGNSWGRATQVLGSFRFYLLPLNESC